MTRRRLLWAGAVLLILLAAAGLEEVLLPPGVVSHIRPGMTFKEVEGLFGRPPDKSESESEEWCESTWSINGGVVQVTADENDQIRTVEFTPTPFLDRFRAWFPW